MATDGVSGAFRPPRLTRRSSSADTVLYEASDSDVELPDGVIDDGVRWDEDTWWVAFWVAKEQMKETTE